MSFNGNQIREFINGVTLNFAGYLQDEFVRLYGNDNALKALVDANTAALASVPTRTVGEIAVRETSFGAISAANPWRMLHEANAALDAANYVDYVPHLRAIKWPQPTSTGTTFTATDYSITSNVVTLTLQNATQENQILAIMQRHYLKTGLYPVVSFSSAIGPIAAGDYQVTGVTVASRTLTFAFTNANTSGSGTYSVEFYPHRIAGSTTTAQWIQRAGDAIFTPGTEHSVAGAGWLDQLQGSITRFGSGGSGDGVSLPSSSGSTYKLPWSNGVGDAQSVYAVQSTDGANDTPRIGKITTPRGFGACVAVYVGEYAP